jgi:hypothetical protein
LFGLKMALKLTNLDKTLKVINLDGISAKLAGHLGGIKTAALYGRIHFVIAGQRGQQVFAQRYTSEDRSRWGKLGGRPKKSNKGTWGEKR